MSHEIKTVKDVIKALGGQTSLAKQIGRTQAAISMWQADGIPASMFPTLSGLLKAKGLTAPDSVFRFHRPKGN